MHSYQGNKLRRENLSTSDQKAGTKHNYNLHKTFIHA